jgi:penicillin amidase
MPAFEAIVGSLASMGLNWLSRGRLAQTDGDLRLDGFAGPVEAIRDPWGVPHIYAGNTLDLMSAQGYVHAQDRLWQMDFQRRLVAGRLSEVLGAETVPVDRWFRILGLRPVAEQEASMLSVEAPEVLANMWAYSAGVNSFIAQGELPVEFALLHYRPEPWSPADMLSWTKMMALSLSVNWESELLRAQLIARLGPEGAAALEPDCADHGPCVVPAGVSYDAIGETAREWVSEARPWAGPPAEDGLGSNAWVLSGARTASGAPLVANDLHQLMGTPSLWYENHLEGGDLTVTGCSFPGVMGVIAGHNGHVAWGLSNGFADVQDLYIERLRHNSEGRIEYLYQDQWLEARVVREVIRVRGRRPVIEYVISTRHGPVINSLAPDLAGEAPLAMQWTCSMPDTIGQAYHCMNRARNCEEFHQALRYWSYPCQHIVYADTAGNAGYTYPGRLPIRAKGDGRVPVPGWTGEYEWIGYVPFDELPHVMSPAQGYVASANNHVVGDGCYPYHISCDFCSGDRAQRICELIEEAPQGIDLAYVHRMQLDQVSPRSRTLAGHLGRLELSDPRLARVAALFKDWDGQLAANSASAVVLETLVPRLMRRLLGARLGDLAPRYMGHGANPVLANGSLLGFRAWEWLQLILADPHSPWFDLGQGETRDDVLRLALRETVDHLQAELGPDIGEWGWGKLHTLTYTHRLSRIKALQPFFDRGPYALGGDYTTICATGATQSGDPQGEAIIGPNYRFIADLGDLRSSVAQLVPGQSGQPGSPHYDDQIEAWFTGEYHPMLFDRRDVERLARARLRLLPV